MKKTIKWLGFVLFIMSVIIPNIHAQNNASRLANERGVAALDAGDFDRAISEFSTAIRLDQNNSIGYFNRGIAYFNKTDFDRAISDFTQAVRIDPNFADAYYWRGYCHMYKLDFARAIPDFENVLRIDPFYPDARESLSLARTMRALEQ